MSTVAKNALALAAATSVAAALAAAAAASGGAATRPGFWQRQARAIMVADSVNTNEPGYAGERINPYRPSVTVYWRAGRPGQ
jgi:hypothetical protein